MSRLLRGAVGGVLGVGLFLVTAEGAVRALNPAPRAQVILGSDVAGHDFRPIRLVEGEPVWAEAGSADRQHPACAPGAVEVLLLGSSIFWGIDLPPDQVVSHQLQERLDGQGAWCVRNHAQPAFVGSNKLAVAREVVPALEPVVVVWEVWTNDAGDYTMIGPDAYNVATRVRDEQGYPVAVPKVPAAVHHALFGTSAAWRYLTLALAPEAAGAYEAAWSRMTGETLPALLELVHAHRGRLLLVFMPSLDRGFADSVAFERDKNRGYQWVHAWAEEHDVDVIDVASAWVGRDPEAVRLDPCCHLNREGQRALSELLAPEVRRLAQEVR